MQQAIKNLSYKELDQKDKITVETAKDHSKEMYVWQADILRITDGTLVKSIPFMAERLSKALISHSDQLFLWLAAAGESFILCYSIVEEHFEPYTIQADLEPDEAAVFETTGTLSVP